MLSCYYYHYDIMYDMVSIFLFPLLAALIHSLPLYLPVDLSELVLRGFGTDFTVFWSLARHQPVGIIHTYTHPGHLIRFSLVSGLKKPL